MAAAEPHPLVDVVAGGETRFVQPDRMGEEWDEQEVDDEATAILGDDDALAESLAESARLLQGLVAGGDAPDHLASLPHRGGIEKVRTDHPVRPSGCPRDL